MTLKNDYPEYRTITNGEYDKLITEMKLRKHSFAPDFTIKTIDGNIMKLSDFKGKFVFIDFWATWCSACIREIPYIKELQKNFSTDELQIIGLANDKISRVDDFVKREKIQYPNAIVGEEILSKYGVYGYPTTFLISPNMEIISDYLRGENLPSIVKSKIEEYKNTNH